MRPISSVESESMSNKGPVDTGRCVVHIDVDAFYAQCEEIRNPILRDRPLGMFDTLLGLTIFPCASIRVFVSAGITQKYLLVTSNYPARRRGVTKLMGITEAQQKCPDLVLVSGEDLSPYRQVAHAVLSHMCKCTVTYANCTVCSTACAVVKDSMCPCRQASKRILTVLQRFGVCERGGMDEMLVDVTLEAGRRVAQGSVPSRWAAHVHSNKVFDDHAFCPWLVKQKLFDESVLCSRSCAS